MLFLHLPWRWHFLLLSLLSRTLGVLLLYLPSNYCCYYHHHYHDDCDYYSSYNYRSATKTFDTMKSHNFLKNKLNAVVTSNRTTVGNSKCSNSDSNCMPPPPPAAPVGPQCTKAELTPLLAQAKRRCSALADACLV